MLVVVLAVGVLLVVVLLRARRTTAVVDEVHKTAIRGVSETLALHDAYPASRLCAVRGRAVLPDGEAPQGPMSERPCAWWRVRVHPRSLMTVAAVHLPVDEISQRPFHIEEGGRRVRVDPDPEMANRYTVVSRLTEAQPRAFADRGTPVTDRVRARFPAVRAYLAPLLFRSVDFTEWRVPAGVDVTVTGWLSWDHEAGEGVLAARGTPGEGPATLDVRVNAA
ncbi:hypothetical protein CLV63_104146 [Murinocardiopsis flavida]|uniref:Uncharacterized protein n=1 Tax=Murinocardiopsis flavida TaxID=645275 RepID=A0A2P8DNX3_9ACTN|nr:hypothetical protein [Murinocardiopsis flavida]PSK98922.1 hypothetical protein CLV63_104146 [Murinocardiopsis flavida]